MFTDDPGMYWGLNLRFDALAMEVRRNFAGGSLGQRMSGTPPAAEVTRRVCYGLDLIPVLDPVQRSSAGKG